ncbi:unnamed protein product [Lactuca virosa]|uniref:Retrotransposon gag domain-containing protein n=1 Tax=Lactuca virosa TaxID=75947 RepID=A0AAU9PE08_9ASTR|nr:unnamed protein product [Lactuca virosa]
MAGGKEVGGTQLKRVESLEAELGHLNDIMENQGHQMQQQADSIASMQMKMDQKFEEVLRALSRGKKTAEEEVFDEPVFSTMDTPKDNSGGPKPGMSSGSDSGGSSDGGGRPQGGEYGGGTNWRFRKLDMPLFDGENPDEWIPRAERYFNFYKLSENDKLEAAVVALEGDALLWFQWEHSRRPVTRSKEMKSLLLRQFRPTNAGTLHQQWLALTQTGSVLEYQRSFIELLAPISNIPEDITLGQFLNGLKDEIRSEVQLLSPVSVEHAMTLAIKVEQKLQSYLQRKPQPSTANQRTNSTGSISGTPMITPIKTTYFTPRAPQIQNPNYTRSNKMPTKPEGEIM